MKGKWNDISEKGMPLNIACEVMQKGGVVSKASHCRSKYQSGICRIEKHSSGKFITTNTFLLKVIKWRILK